MEITELVWKLFVILLPGVVSTLMVRYITTHKQYSIFEFLIYSACLGIGTFIIMELFYSLFWAIYGILSSNISTEFGLNLKIWDSLINGVSSIDKNELFLSYLLAIPFGFFWGFVISNKIVIRLFQKWKLTTRYGDNDVWSFYFNSPNTNWIYLHNKKENLTYFGKIRAYSDTGEKREVLIEDVIVYASDKWEQLYESDAVYLELSDDNYTIETPKLKENGTDTKNC